MKKMSESLIMVFVMVFAVTAMIACSSNKPALTDSQTQEQAQDPAVNLGNQGSGQQRPDIQRSATNDSPSVASNEDNNMGLHTQDNSQALDPGNSSRMDGKTGRNDTQFQQMMQQAISACSGKSQDDSCTVTTPQGTMNGTCSSQNGELSCRPAMDQQGMQGGPQGPAPQDAIAQ